MNADELEYRLLFAMVVAGKSEKFATAAMHRFLGNAGSPFTWVRLLVQGGILESRLRTARTGNYGKLERGFREAATCGLNLATATPEQLEQVHGIGPKTSRFFIIWTRPEAKHAALDTHVLKWLRYLGHKAPRATPSSAKYGALEKVILAEAKWRGMTARELDAAIWDYCSRMENRFAVAQGIWPDKLRKPA